jgi:hypothetical protein
MLSVTVSVDVFREQLHQDAVDRGVAVEARDQRQELVLRNGFRQVEFEGIHADGLGRAPLVAHVDLRRRMLADENDGKPRRRFAGRDPCRDRYLHFRRHALGARLAVDDAGGHGSSKKDRDSTGFEASASAFRAPAPPVWDRD